MTLPAWAERALTWVLALALVASTAGVVAISLTPTEKDDPYTEFYVLGPGNNASDYPTDLSPGGTETVTLGISNHEHETVEYRVAVTWNDSTTGERTVVVPDGETEEFEVELTAPEEPGRYRVQIELYRTDRKRTEPYRWLQLWVTVTEE